MLIFNKQDPGLFLATRVRRCVVLHQPNKASEVIDWGEGGEGQERSGTLSFFNIKFAM